MLSLRRRAASLATIMATSPLTSLSLLLIIRRAR
jgi:hypothetical protein